MRKDLMIKLLFILFILFTIVTIIFVGNIFMFAASFDPAAYYKIVNQNSGKVIDVTNTSKDNGANIIQWTDKEQQNQQWQIVDVGNSNFKIISRNSGKALDVNGWSKDNGASIIQWDYVGGSNQLWRFEDNGNGYYRIINVNSGKALNVTSSSNEDGARLEQWTDNRWSSQQWRVEMVDSNTNTPDGKSLVWSDEFDDSSINTSNWGYEIGYKRNNELQYYTNRTENARIENDNLVIEAKKESYNGYTYTSASLLTSGKKTFKYGRFEIRAKIPTAAGCWPAFWTLGVSNPWPKNGEVDIMEYYQGKILANIAYQSINGSTSWDSFSKVILNYGSSWANNYHIWSMDWDSSSIKLYVDNELLNTFNVDDANNGTYNPFRQNHYIIVNLAIGGNAGGDPYGTTFPQRYYIDYVRVYQ